MLPRIDKASFSTRQLPKSCSSKTCRPYRRAGSDSVSQSLRSESCA
jgi:hypothetical protein